MLPGTVTSDTDLVAELLGNELGHLPEAGQRRSRPRAGAGDGAPAPRGCLLARPDGRAHVIGVRDPHGFRPLCLGKLDNGWVLASETPALDVVGAHFVRELDPGEMVVIDATGARSTALPGRADRPEALPASSSSTSPAPTGASTARTSTRRVPHGRAARRAGAVEADMVMGVPESGIPAAEGFARRSGIPFGQGLVKNRYIGRTFIAPSQEMRARGVRMKLNPLRENIAGKRMVVVDDSIVRGTTPEAARQMLREAGAAEVHLRITSPP